MKYSIAAVALSATYASAQIGNLAACGTQCVAGVQKNLMAAPYNCAAGDISCFCSTPDYGYGVRDCTDVVCNSNADKMAAILYAAAQCASVGSPLTGTGLPTGVTASSLMAGASSMPGGGLGLGVPLSTVTTTNMGGMTYTGIVVAQTDSAGSTFGTATITTLLGAGGSGGTTATTTATATATVTGGAGGVGGVVGGVPISTVVTNMMTEVVYAQTNAAGSTTATTTIPVVTGGSMMSNGSSGATGVMIGGVAGVPISTITTRMNGMAVTETVLAETNAAGSTTATTTIGGASGTTGAAGALVTITTTGTDGMPTTTAVPAAQASTLTGGMGGMMTTTRMGGGAVSSTVVSTTVAVVTTSAGANGAAMQTAGPLMGAAGIAALLLI